MRGINCTVLWIKALYKCSPFTICHFFGYDWSGEGWAGAGGNPFNQSVGTPFRWPPLTEPKKTTSPVTFWALSGFCLCFSCLLLLVISICLYGNLSSASTRVPQLCLCVYVYFWSEIEHSPKSLSHGYFGYFPSLAVSIRSSFLPHLQRTKHSCFTLICIIIISSLLCRS